ncbi:hypothetical protein QT711_03245 [Sporosarcina saromensis]|uniref:Uncharacterized protein n=1 Tax=Sporosarcina saromensis TaxID=359365 RepID=A0ABU4G5G0_9BACL|nr:hypothetical protein [Sporosarcina saromensis]MDW0112186.1 hypothetical protein [Sporosarcina saromensis]
MAKRLTVEINEEQYKALQQFAGAYNITISQILGSYVADLVEIDSNGSDEREFCKQYFDRTYLSWMYLK